MTYISALVSTRLADFLLVKSPMVIFREGTRNIISLLTGGKAYQRYVKCGGVSDLQSSV